MVDKIPVSEKDLASLVEDCLERFGWRWAHIRPARVNRQKFNKATRQWEIKEIYETAYTGHKGLPDYCLCVRPPRIVIIELKSEKGTLSPDQLLWITALEDCQITVILEPLAIKRGKASISLKSGQKVLTIPEVYLWRPSQRDEILEILR